MKFERHLRFIRIMRCNCRVSWFWNSKTSFPEKEQRIAKKQIVRKTGKRGKILLLHRVVINLEVNFIIFQHFSPLPWSPRLFIKYSSCCSYEIIQKNCVWIGNQKIFIFDNIASQKILSANPIQGRTNVGSKQ